MNFTKEDKMCVEEMKHFHRAVQGIREDFRHNLITEEKRKWLIEKLFDHIIGRISLKQLEDYFSTSF